MEKLSKPAEDMTDEELRIEIAEWCGFPVNVCMCGDSRKAWAHSSEHSFTPICELKDVPNYPSDLNAVWEAEERLIRQSSVIGWEQYTMALRRVCWEDKNVQKPEHATARNAPSRSLRPSRTYENPSGEMPNTKPSPLTTNHRNETTKP